MQQGRPAVVSGSNVQQDRGRPTVKFPAPLEV
jgi:hypothetical protein